MAPDRGASDYQQTRHARQEDGSRVNEEEDAAAILASRASEPQNFTLRSLVLGLLIGIVICFSNTYFGLQTGWISGMAMPSALIGFAYFKAVSRTLSYPFTPVENVLVQTVAGSVGTMPLGCGFVGVIPALEFLLKPTETPDGSTGLKLPLGKLIVWALGICFFGVVFAVPLRKEVIIREKLKFPSGTATALMIGVLHGGSENSGIVKMGMSGDDRTNKDGDDEQESEEEQRLIAGAPAESHDLHHQDTRQSQTAEAENAGKSDDRSDWKGNIKLLTVSFAISAIYVCYLDCFQDAHVMFRGAILRRLTCSRRSRPILFPSYTTFHFSDCLWQTIGSGLSIHLQHMSVRASSWALRRRFTCCWVPSSAGASYHHLPNPKDGLPAL